MNNQFKILMWVSALAFLILSGIQYYLIENTYKYKISAFEKELKSRTSDFSKEFTLSDTIQDAGISMLYSYAERYYDGLLSKDQMIDSIFELRSIDSLNQLLIQDFHKQMGDTSLEFGCVLKDFVLFDTLTKRPDTLISSSPIMENVLYGNLSSLKEAIVVNTGTTASNLSMGDKKNSLIISTVNFVSLHKWKDKVLRDMWSFIALAVSILLAVIGLFIYTFRAWLRQKKMTEIKNDFINNITHEFKTPLATLQIASKSLRKDKVLESVSMRENTLDSIDRQNKRLQKLLDQVMSQSLGLSELDLQKDTHNVGDLINDTVQDYMLSQNENQVEIETDLQASGLIHIDRFYMTTAILNVLDNAVKYSKNGAQMKVSSSRIQDDLVLDFEDHGIGIAKNDLDVIFEKFYRVHTGDTHDVKGLGLGLYYTKNIVDAHGGTIDIDSKMGKGTKVSIRLTNVFV